MLGQRDRIILVAQLADSLIARTADTSFIEAVLYGLELLKTAETQLDLEASDPIGLKPWMKWIQEDGIHTLVAHHRLTEERIVAQFFPDDWRWYVDNPNYSIYFKGSVNVNTSIEDIKKKIQYLIPMEAWSEWNESLKV